MYWWLWAALAWAGPLGGGGEHRTLKTPHFKVHYPAHEAEQSAQRVAQAAEHLWLRLSDETGFFPQERIHIVLVHTEGEGYARSERDLVVISARPGVKHQTLRGISDPIWDVLAHELSHVWSQKAAGSLSERVGMVELGARSEGRGGALGLRLALGASRPLVWSEGAAEWLSERAGVNRWTTGRKQTLRAAHQAGRLLSWGQLQSARIERPSLDGELAYQQGYAFARWLDSRFGPGTVDAIGRQASRGIGVGLDGAIRAVTGQRAAALYEAHLDTLRAELRAEGAARAAQGLVDATAQAEGAGARRGARAAWGLGARISGEGFRRAEARSGRIRVVELDEERPGAPLQVPARSEARFDFVGEEALIVVASRQRLAAWGLHRGGDAQDRLWRISLPEVGGALKRADFREIPGTEGARDPAVSPDGERVAWLRYRDGSTELMISALDGSTHQVLRGGVEGAWMQGLTWSPDGRQLAVSMHRDHQVNLWAIPVEGGDWHPLTSDRFEAVDPFWAPEGIYFAADPDGYFDLYRLDPERGTILQLTRTATGLRAPAPTKDGLVCSRYTVDGWVLATLPRQEWLLQPVEGSDTLRGIGAGAREPQSAPSPQIDPLESAPYRPSRSLMAWSLSPMLRVDGGAEGPRVLAGGRVRVEDARRVHTWRALGLIGEDRLAQTDWTWRPGAVSVGLFASHARGPWRPDEAWRVQRLDQAAVSGAWRLQPGLALWVEGRALRGSDPSPGPTLRSHRATFGIRAGDGQDLRRIDAAGTAAELGFRMGRSSVEGGGPGFEAPRGWAGLLGRVHGLTPLGRGLPGSLHRLEWGLSLASTSRNLHPLEQLHLGGDHPYAARLGAVQASGSFPGYPPYSLGGEALVVGTLGWRLPLGGEVGRLVGPVHLERFEGRLATDLGQIWRAEGWLPTAPASGARVLADTVVELRAGASWADRPFDTFLRVAAPLVPLRDGAPGPAVKVGAPRLYLGIGTGW